MLYFNQRLQFLKCFVVYTCAATSPTQDFHNDSYNEDQAMEESHHGIAVLGMEVSESVSAGAVAMGETLILDSYEEESTVVEPEQESSQQETQSKPSESVLPRNVPLTGVAIVAGMFTFCYFALCSLFCCEVYYFRVL